MTTQTRPEVPEALVRPLLLAILKAEIKEDAVRLRSWKHEIRETQKLMGSGAAANEQSRLYRSRLEARARLLIYGLLRGRSWDEIEPKHGPLPGYFKTIVAQVWKQTQTKLAATLPMTPPALLSQLA